MTCIFNNFEFIFLRKFINFFISQLEPAKCTGINIFGNLFLSLAILSFSSNLFILINPVDKSISTKSISQEYKAQLAEATNVLGLVQTKSFSLSSNAKHAR